MSFDFATQRPLGKMVLQETLRHSALLLNRLQWVHGATPCELVYNNVYKGRVREFAEPAYTHTSPTWCFKTGFGGRLIPTRTVETLPAPRNAPTGPVFPSAFHDADGAVKQKA